MGKKNLRKLMLNKRNSLSLDLKKEYDLKIFEKLKNILSNYSNIASYSSFASEVDTETINKWILENKNLYLPKLIDDNINFRKVNDLNLFELGKYDIKEPISDIGFDINNLDCIIVPLICFNSKNYRIGYGKGYYDRILKNYKGFKIGIAYSIQYCDEFVEEVHDIKLDLIINEN